MRRRGQIPELVTRLLDKRRRNPGRLAAGGPGAQGPCKSVAEEFVRRPAGQPGQRGVAVVSMEFPGGRSNEQVMP
jgi:hypothetical protein